MQIINLSLGLDKSQSIWVDSTFLFLSFVSSLLVICTIIDESVLHYLLC
jgi:hypothetical protein